jgi:hypothetical protein
MATTVTAVASIPGGNGIQNIRNVDQRKTAETEIQKVIN